MIYRFIKKFKKVICLFLVMCITVPLLSACGEQENNLKVNVKNKIIGEGGNIEAYTTYSQAKFMEMDKQMYHSYLLSMRDFILVVLPEGEDGVPDQSNYMFQAVYNGVTPYAEQIVGGNFQFKNPEYKLLIYYVLADEFLSWDKKANNEADRSFLASALDFLGPSDADNYEANLSFHNGKLSLLEANVVENDEQYNLKNVVNMNSYLTECDFLRVDDNYNIISYSDEGVKGSNALNKCGYRDNGIPIGKNVIADVAKGSSKGVTLLYGGGGLSGYFTYEQVNAYNFENAGWIKTLLDSHGGNMEQYVRDTLSTVCPNSSYPSDHFCHSSNINSYAARTTYKFKYDIALLGRINKIHYNTILDFNFNGIQTGVQTISNVDTYSTILEGTTTKNSGDYIAFTTADGFIIDRGNIVMSAGEDLLFDTDMLEMLTQMDACTNRTLASYVAEALAITGIVVGGIAVAVGAAVLAYTAGAALLSTATFGLASLSVPGIGWIIGGVVLLAVGIIALTVSVPAKKAINDTNSANFCNVYKEAVTEIINTSYIRTPIYHYNIPEDNDYTTELCYSEYVEDPENPEGPKKCGTYVVDEATGNKTFVESTSIPTFKMADVNQVNTLNQLTGSPSLRLYSDGKFVDEVYGAGSPQFLYAIMDSWGVTSAASMRYQVALNRDVSNNVTSYSIYDLMYTASDRGRITKASYCITEKYEEACTSVNETVINGLSYSSFDNGVYRKGIGTSDIVNKKNNLVNKIKREYEEGKTLNEEFANYKQRLKDIANYFDVEVNKESDDNYYATLNGNKYLISEEGPNIYLEKEGEKILANGDFELNGLKFNLRKDATKGYIIDCPFTNVGSILDEIKDKFDSGADSVVETLKSELQVPFDNKSKAEYEELVDKMDTKFDGLAYSAEDVPIYFTVTIQEEKDGETVTTTTSAYYETVVLELKQEGTEEN